MGAPSKRARKIRSAKEFDLARLRTVLSMPVDARASAFAWSLADIMIARDAQLRGLFRLPARLVESMRTDDALHVAYLNRLAPQRCLGVELEPGKGARAGLVKGEAEALYGKDGVGLKSETLNSVTGCLVNHGVAFGVNAATPRPDGSRIDLEMHYWPIDYVRWDPVARCFKTLVDPSTVQPGDIPADPSYGATSGYEIPIIHGDGRWVIFQQHEVDSWKQEAAVLSAALVWARHAFANRDWAKGSVAHATAKIVGELPSGVPLQEKGAISDEAAAFLELLRALATSDLPIGIRPAGSKTEFVTNTSTAWEVWNQLVLNAEKSAARIYLGTDGTLGAQGGAPGVDITELFGVATTRVQGDLECIERALLTGVIEPWCAMNFGDSALAPKRCYIMPDADGDRARASYAQRKTAFFADIAAARQNGFSITQEYVDAVAKKYDLDAPTLAPAPPAAPAAPAASSPATSPAASPPPPTGLRLVPPPAEPNAMVRAEHASRMNAALLADIREARALGLEYSQKQIEDTAARYGVSAPKLLSAKT